MQPFLTTLNIVLPVFAVIFLGGLLRLKGLIDSAFLRQANRLLYYILLPLLLFYKIGTADFESSFNAKLTLAMIAALSLGALSSYALGSILGCPAEDRGSFSQGAFRGNLAYVGLPIVLSAYGETGFTRAGLLMGCLVPTINLLSILVLLLPQRHSHPDRTWKLIRDQLLCNPLILGSLAGIVWSLCHLPMPGMAARSLHLITGATLPLALLAIGGAFSLQQLQGDLKQAGLATVYKLAAFPLLNLLMLQLFAVKGMDLGIAVLLSGTPTAAASYVMALEMNSNAQLTSSIIVLSTLFCAGSFTIMLTLLGLMNLLPT
ncbi:membrane protein [Syntrophotalea carbinolica DSM 2380]|uniref:Membrane protein n=1 Tax=Syntrophotalea carbinolica (strain DSM 2380 / NBRC 103641 / GraBd1) TaxID=338963 RepID=Q3A360_SYNC1|nr:AEC family transporter [Syntrophotalea carbinolica]ABA89197.1 membrane protein [Syntrophotalea carbinolica DSM 2380]